MSRLLTSFVFVAGLQSALAVPVDQAVAIDSASTAKKTFSLEQVARYPQQPKSFAEIEARPYLKYGVDLPEGVQTAMRHIQLEGAEAPGDGTTTVPVKAAKGEAKYLFQVKVGTHTLWLDPDTGSADLWVMSTLMPQNQRSGRPVARVYDVKGTGKEMSGASWQIRYGDQSTAKGKVYRDKVTIGSLSVNDQAVEAASQVSASFSKDPANDGLLGLAFSQLNQVRPQKQKTWFENIKPQLKEPLFAVAMNRRAPGTYDFGFIDRKKYTGEITWMPVKGAKGFWDISPTGFQVGNGPVKQGNPNSIVDTGSSLWYMPKEYVQSYYAQVPGAKISGVQQAWTFPCSSKLPDITIHFAGNKKVRVPGINMNYQQAGPQNCFGGLQPNKGMPFNIFGDVFMKGLYVVHEHKTGQQPRLGFAPQAKGAIGANVKAVGNSSFIDSL